MKCPRCGYDPNKEVRWLSGDEVMRLLGPNVDDRWLYRDQRGGWHLTSLHNANVSDEVVADLKRRGLIWQRYSDLPNDAFGICPTIDCAATIKARKANKNVDLVFVGPSA